MSKILNESIENPNLLVCPLCGQPNSCANLSADDVAGTCWCNDSSIKFPEVLLAQIPPEQRNKACICKACALKFQESH